jgi:hypothetical protein
MCPWKDETLPCHHPLFGTRIAFRGALITAYHMRVAILIVRLIGIVMLLYGAFSVYGLHTVANMGPPMFSSAQGTPDPVPEQFAPFHQFQVIANTVSYGILLVGIVLTMFSARVCRLLTFDYRES